MSNETNKIFAAVLCAGVTVWLAGFIAEKSLTPAPLEKDAIFVEGAAEGEHGGAASNAPSFAAPILALIASADAEKGAKISKACAACHSFEKGGSTKQGPNLWGIVGHPKGATAGFDYSEGLKAKGGNWDMASLNQFLWKPKKFIDGTKMNFAGIGKDQDRADLIAWLRAQSDSPAADPSEADIAAENEAYAPKAEEVAPVEGAVPAEGVEAPAATEEKPAEKEAAPAAH